MKDSLKSVWVTVSTTLVVPTALVTIPTDGLSVEPLNVVAALVEVLELIVDEEPNSAVVEREIKLVVVPVALIDVMYPLVTLKDPVAVRVVCVVNGPPIGPPTSKPKELNEEEPEADSTDTKEKSTRRAVVHEIMRPENTAQMDFLRAAPLWP